MSTGPLLLLITILLLPAFLIIWNRQRCKGKMLCFMLRKDKSLDVSLCKLWNDFVIYHDRAFDVYPDFVRLARFPMGWPSALQELVPSALYLEEDAIPLDWINLDDRKVRSMELRSSLDENFFRKMIHETTYEGGGISFNWRRALPFVLIALALLALGFFLFVWRPSA